MDRVHAASQTSHCSLAPFAGEGKGDRCGEGVWMDGWMDVREIVDLWIGGFHAGWGGVRDGMGTYELYNPSFSSSWEEGMGLEGRMLCISQNSLFYFSPGLPFVEGVDVIKMYQRASEVI